MVYNLITVSRTGLHFKKTLEIVLSGPLVHIVEFESNFKLTQFLQLIKMFRTREYLEATGEVTGLHDGIKPIENQLHLIPPCI